MEKEIGEVQIDDIVVYGDAADTGIGKVVPYRIIGTLPSNYDVYDEYCDECPDFPCADVMEKETRYTTQYPHRESPLENLKMIREHGMDVFLEHERQHWTCPKCGNPFSVHHNTCSKCKTRLT